MIKKIFTVARNDKKSRKKAIEILGKGGYFIDQTASTQINSAYQDPNDFI